MLAYDAQRQIREQQRRERRAGDSSGDSSSPEEVSPTTAWANSLRGGASSTNTNSNSRNSNSNPNRREREREQRQRQGQRRRSMSVGGRVINSSVETRPRTTASSSSGQSQSGVWNEYAANNNPSTRRDPVQQSTATVSGERPSRSIDERIAHLSTDSSSSSQQTSQNSQPTNVQRERANAWNSWSLTPRTREERQRQESARRAVVDNAQQFAQDVLSSDQSGEQLLPAAVRDTNQANSEGSSSSGSRRVPVVDVSVPARSSSRQRPTTNTNRYGNRQRSQSLGGARISSNVIFFLGF